MPDDPNEHFFACHLLWWSLRVSFDTELVKTGALADRLEDYNLRLEDIGAWLMDELVRAGRAYRVDGQPRAIPNIEAAEIEQRLRRSLKALDDLAASVAPDEAPGSCAYVAQCSWVVATLRAFVELERALASAPFAAIEDEFIDVMSWLEAQRDAVAASEISAGTRTALHDHTAPVIDAAAHAWRDEVRAISARYPRS
jgi:hypothetical protein